MIMGAFRRYGQSKLANILYPAELARKYPSVTFLSIHPGVINTGLISGSNISRFNYLFTEVTTFGSQVSIEEGTKNMLWAASADKSTVVNGEYYEPVGKPGGHTSASKNKKLATELYDWTEEALAEF